MYISLSRYDYLKISNDVNETFGTYCGVWTGRTVTVTGNQVVMTFHSDKSVQKKGFIITLTSIPIGKCNRRLSFQTAAVFFSVKKCIFLLKKNKRAFFCKNWKRKISKVADFMKL